MKRAPEMGPPLPVRSPSDIRDTLRRGELVFPPEADTLTAHGTRPLSEPGTRQRHTLPIPPPIPGQPIMGVPLLGALPSQAVPSISTMVGPLEDDDGVTERLDRDGADEEMTATAQLAFVPSADDPETSPTLSLEERSEASREVYRLFLASEYAPALYLADELIARGDQDPMLVTIARECRVSVGSDMGRSAAPARPDRSPFRGLTFDGSMTIAEVASLTDLSLEQIIGLLERFVLMGVLTVRPPPR
jgi:hypothetical protein